MAPLHLFNANFKLIVKHREQLDKLELELEDGWLILAPNLYLRYI